MHDKRKCRENILNRKDHMKFQVYYRVGKAIREKNIMAKDLEEAEAICNEKFKNWEDIIMTDKTKGVVEY